MRRTGVVDTTVGRGEQDIDAWGNETRKDGPNALSQPLLFRRRTQQKSDSKVSRKIYMQSQQLA